MRPPTKASVFSLDVIVHDVTHEAECVAGSLARDNLAIACRFLDYPLFFIRPRSKQRDHKTIKFNNGKSCALSEVKTRLKDSLQQVPLYVLLFNCTRPAHPVVLGAGATQMQLGRAGSSKPGEQHLVALYSPSGERLGHARLQAHLCDHGTSLAAHLPQKLQPDGSSLRKRHNTKRLPGESHRCSRKGRLGPKKVHVHYHLESPPPPRNRSRNCRGKTRATSKGKERQYRYCSMERPVTGPEQRGQEQPSWLASGNKANSISAPSTPWHRPAGCVEECQDQPQGAASVEQPVPPVTICTTHQPNDAAKVCQSQNQGRAAEQPSSGLQRMHNCTVCGSGHHFKTPATQDITAVACEMMTLVSMRTAMSEVLGSLVHKWRDVMPSSLDLPGMHQEATTGSKAPQKGACMQTGGAAAEWTIPASAGANKQTHEGGPQPQDDRNTASSHHAPSEQMRARSQHSQLPAVPARARLLQGRSSPPAAGVHGSGAAARGVGAVEQLQEGKLLDRSTEAGPAVGPLPSTAGRGTSGGRRRKVKPAKKPEPGRDDSMSGPFQVTFAPGVPESSAKKSKKRSSGHSRSSQKQQVDRKAPASAAIIPEHSPAVCAMDEQPAVSMATQEEVYTSSDFDWTESAVSVATDTAAHSAAAEKSQQNAMLAKSAEMNAEKDRIPVEDPQEVGSVEGATACVDLVHSAQPVQSQVSRSESAWPLSDDDTVPMVEDSSVHGAVQTQAAGGAAPLAAMPVEDDSIASGTHRTILSSQGSEAKSSRSSRSKDNDAKGRLGSGGKCNGSERSQTMQGSSSIPSTAYSSHYTGSKPSESARTVAHSDMSAPTRTQEPVQKHSSSVQSETISEDTPLMQAASRVQSKAASSVISRQPSAISMSSMSASLISDGTISLNGSVQDKEHNRDASDSKSFVTMSSVSDGCSSASQSSSSSYTSNDSSSIMSESAPGVETSGSPATTGGLEEVTPSQSSREPSAATSAPHSIESSRSNTYTTGYTMTTGYTSPETIAEEANGQRTAATSAADSSMHLDSTLHADRSATGHRYQSEEGTYEVETSEPQTSSGGESGTSSHDPPAAAHRAWQHPSSQLPYAQHMPQFQQMHYMHQLQDTDGWNAPQAWNSRAQMHGAGGAPQHPHEDEEYSDVDTRSPSGPDHSARLSEIDRSLAGTTMRSGMETPSSSDYSMASGEASSESGASLEP